jgi:transposase-like protein
VIHLLRNSFRYASRAHWDAITKALRPLYTAPTLEAAEERFLEFSETWGSKYPAIIKLWTSAWEEFISFLAWDTDIRRIICTTNAIESLNARYRRAVRARGHFLRRHRRVEVPVSGDPLLDPTGRGRVRWTNRWKPALNAFAISFPGHLNPAKDN